jgi:ADP-heptose:LPS heptosyltransferase
MQPLANPAIAFRRLERKFKAWFIARLSSLMTPRQLPSPPDWSSRPHRIVMLRYDRLGDMVLSTGIIKAIALAQPTVIIDVLASVQNAVVLEGNPRVGNILTVDRRRPWTWIVAIGRMRRLRYDAVIDVMVMAPSLTTTLIMGISGAQHRIGLGDRGHGSSFTLPVARLRDAVHYVDHSAALLAAFGVDPRSLAEQHAQRNGGLDRRSRSSQTEDTGIGGWGIWRPEIFLTATEIASGEAHWRRAASHVGRAERIAARLVVNVSSGGAWRYWPSTSFIAAMKSLRSKFPRLECIVIGAPRDAQRMETIGRASGAAVTHTAHAREMMAIIATSDVVFTADTAVTHIASAFGKPTLVMFARAKADLWGPYDVPGYAVSTPGESLDSLDVASVLPKLIEMVAVASQSARGLPPARRLAPTAPAL